VEKGRDRPCGNIERAGLGGEKKKKNGSRPTEGRGELGHAGRKGERGGERAFFFSFSISFLISNPNSNMV